MPANALNRAVAAELDAMRRYAGMTQADLARNAGISLSSVQRYLDGTRPIRVDHLGSMAVALGRDPIEVLTAATARIKQE